MNLEERNRPLGTSILSLSERETPRSTSRKEETGTWICADTRCVSTSCTYSLASRAYHQSWLLPAQRPLVKPQQSPRFIEMSHCCTHACSKHAKLLQQTQPPRQSHFSCPAYNLWSLGARTWALDTLCGLRYSEAKFLHPR